MNGTSPASFDEESWRAHYADADDGGARTSGIHLLDGPGIAAELPPLQYLCAELGMVAGGGAPHLIAGYGYSGKTVAAQAMCLALAAGRAVWGAHRVGRHKILHIDLEQGERLTRRRYQRLARASSIELHELGDDIALACLPRLSLAAEYVDTWLELMTGRDMIVIDSLRAATGGVDENESAIRVPLDMLTRLSEQTKCRALVLHHGRKPSGDGSGGGEDKFSIRGSSAIFDACDSVWVFVASKGEPVSVRQVKARSNGEPIDDFALVIEDVDGAGDDPTWGLSVRVHGVELIAKVREERAERAEERRGEADIRAVERALAKHPGALTTDLRAVTGLGGARLAAALLAMGDRIDRRPEQDGRVRRVRHFLVPGRPS